MTVPVLAPGQVLSVPCIVSHSMSKYNATALIVDDQDPSVHYSPGWTKADNMTHEYHFTQTGAQRKGMTATFDFVGERVASALIYST